jgi:UDP-N-acetylenolpyruvoylglucosamine reductase
LKDSAENSDDQQTQIDDSAQHIEESGMNLQEYLYNEPTTNAVSVTKAPPVHKMMQPNQVNRWRQIKTIYKLPGSIGGFQL